MLARVGIVVSDRWTLGMSPSGLSWSQSVDAEGMTTLTLSSYKVFIVTVYSLFETILAWAISAIMCLVVVHGW